jgi:enoyl-CoA hydratase/carnithine racemase
MNFAQRPGHEFRVQFTDGPGFGGITRGLKVSKPAIAAINGFAISGGLSLRSPATFASARAMPNSRFRTFDGVFTPAMADSFVCRRSWVSATPWKSY